MALAVLASTVTSCRGSDAGSSAPGAIEGRFDVGSYRMWLSCTGSGSPTVVFDAGLGTGGETWSGIRPTVARTTRSCVYDRAGIGQSEAPPGARTTTVGGRADELMRLLAAARIDGPLVLVGHSYGGMVAQLTAHRHPDRVVGVVLVDSASRHEMEGEWLANDVPWFDGATEVDRPASATELAVVDDLGHIPLVVLSQGRIDGQFAIEWPRLQNELATLSTNTVHAVADTGHMIQSEAPDLVKQAVASVVQSVRTGTKLPPCGQGVHGGRRDVSGSRGTIRETVAPYLENGHDGRQRMKRIGAAAGRSRPLGRRTRREQFGCAGRRRV